MICKSSSVHYLQFILCVFLLHFSTVLIAQSQSLEGCTDINASNYNSNATIEDYSCISWQELANQLQLTIDALDLDDGVGPEHVEAAYNSGYNSGFSFGQDIGYTSGELSGFNEGEDYGYNLGYTAGASSVTPDDGIGQVNVDAAYSSGFSVGYTEGEQNGYTSGELSGFNEGEDYGYNLGYTAGVNNGYDIGLSEGILSVTPEDGIGPDDLVIFYNNGYQDGIDFNDSLLCNEFYLEDISLSLPQGWSMFGYSCIGNINVVDAFNEISDKISIVKDELGMAYLPSWGFNALGELKYSEGYQIKMLENVDEFQFCPTIVEIVE